MTPTPEETTELDLILADARAASGGLLASRNHVDGAPIVFATFPPAILVAEEVHNYFAQSRRAERLGSINGPLFDAFGNAVKKVRARIKLLDDNDTGPANLVAFMALARERSGVLFKHPSSRLLQAISGPFRPDLGAFFAGQHLVATTHALLPTMGFTREVLLSAGPGEFEKLLDYVRPFAESLGGFFLQLKRVLAAHDRDLDLQTISPIAEVFQTSKVDFVAERFYCHAEKCLLTAAPEKCATLTVCLAQANQAIYLLPALLGPESNLLRRVQYMTAYHGSEALRVALRTIPSWLEPRADDVLMAKPVRNLMAHYGLRDASRFTVGASDAFCAAVSGLAGVKADVVFVAAEKRLQRLSQLIGSGLTKRSLWPHRAFLGTHT